MMVPIRTNVQRTAVQWWVALSLLLSLYLLQAWTPLRLNTDAIVLLSMAAPEMSSAAAHSAHAQVFPPGFPFLVALLDRYGLAGSGSFVLLNCAFLAVGTAAAMMMLRRALQLSPAVSALMSALGLLSYVVIKHATIPLTDIPYFGVSMLSLLMLLKAEQDDRATWYRSLLIAWALAIAAITLRRIGIALVPPIVWVLAQRMIRSGAEIRQPSHIRLITGAFACVALSVLTAWAVSGAFVLTDAATDRSGHLGIELLGFLTATRLTELGESALNIPAARLPEIFRIVFEFAGLVVIALIANGVRRLRPLISAFSIYLGFYGAVLAFWPYYDPRFWLPVLPLLLGLSALGLPEASGSQNSELVRKLAVSSWIFSFVAAGLVAFAWSTKLTFSGDAFAETYGNDSLRATYRVAFGASSAPPEAGLNEDALRLLQKYEPHAKRVARNIAREAN